MSKLREHGYERLDQVKVARMESDGEITVLGNEPPPGDDAQKARQTRGGSVSRA